MKKFGLWQSMSVAQNLANFPDDEKRSVILSTNGVTNTVSNTYGTNDATSGGWIENRVTVVSEPGLYRLIFMSRKPEAEKIKRWVFHEVLPSIRKYGFYGLLNGEQVRYLPIKEYVHYLGELTPEQYENYLRQMTIEQGREHYERLRENLPNMTQEEIKNLANDPCVIVRRVGHEPWKAEFFC